MSRRISKGRKPSRSAALPFSRAARSLAEIARDFHRRGWALGTSGNFSAVVSWEPLRLAITGSGLDKSSLTARHFVQIDGEGRVVSGSFRPSAETALHLEVVRARRAGAVLHTHSVWSTILSEAFAAQGHLPMQGFEMLKGLEGVRTHEHCECLPVIDNSQEIPRLMEWMVKALDQWPDAHGVLLRRHGLYTWGADLFQARRHAEILEFLLEALGHEYCRARLSRGSS